MTTRRQFSAQEKMQILRRHLREHKPISKVCQQYDLNPNLFYRWQQELFEHGTVAFERTSNGVENRAAQKLQKEIVQLKARLTSKDEVIAEIMAEQVRQKRTLGPAGTTPGPNPTSATRSSITCVTGATGPASVTARPFNGSASAAWPSISRFECPLAQLPLPFQTASTTALSLVARGHPSAGQRRRYISACPAPNEQYMAAPPLLSPSSASSPPRSNSQS